MSSEFDMHNPHWSRVGDLEETFFSVNDETELPQTFNATWRLVQRSTDRFDLAIFLLERLNLEEFRFQSGRLNYRKIAKALNKSIAERNAWEAGRRGGRGRVHEVGLRSMELTVKSLLEQK